MKISKKVLNHFIKIVIKMMQNQKIKKIIVTAKIFFKESII